MSNGINNNGINDNKYRCALSLKYSESKYSKNLGLDEINKQNAAIKNCIVILKKSFIKKDLNEFTIFIINKEDMLKNISKAKNIEYETTEFGCFGGGG